MTAESLPSWLRGEQQKAQTLSDPQLSRALDRAVNFSTWLHRFVVAECAGYAVIAVAAASQENWIGIGASALAWAASMKPQQALDMANYRRMHLLREEFRVRGHTVLNTRHS